MVKLFPRVFRLIPPNWPSKYLRWLIIYYNYIVINLLISFFFFFFLHGTRLLTGRKKNINWHKNHLNWLINCVTILIQRRNKLSLAAIMKTGSHVGFSNDQSGRFDKYLKENHPKFGVLLQFAWLVLLSVLPCG